VEQQVEADTDLTARLGRIQLPPDIIDFQTFDQTRDEGQGMITSNNEAMTPVRTGSPLPHEIPELDVPEVEPAMQPTLDVVLAATRVYSRVNDRDVDAMTSVSTTRSRAWSVLSGLSMAEISVIAVISLPLYEPELRRFRQLVWPHHPSESGIRFDDIFEIEDFDALEVEDSATSDLNPPFTSRSGLKPPARFQHDTKEFRRTYGLVWNSGGLPRGGVKKILKDLGDMSRNPPPLCSAGPIGDDMVRFCVEFLRMFKLTNISITGKERLRGL